MGRILLFWMQFPPDPTMNLHRWIGFIDEIANWILLCVLITVGLIVGLYWKYARNKRIHRPNDLFQKYSPLSWLWLSCAPVLVVFTVYSVKFNSLFFDAGVSFMAGAVEVSVWAGILSFLLASLLLCIPGITPAKFRYRPLWFVYRKRGGRVS